MNPAAEKICASCGRPFAYRRKWARCWDQVRYCSQRCRRRGLTRTDRELEAAIIELLDRRSGTICPSEAARAVAPDAWRELMEPARCAARRLAARRVVAVLQRGRPVDAAAFKGPIRLGRGDDYRSSSSRN